MTDRSTHAADCEAMQPDPLTEAFGSVERLSRELIPAATFLLSPDVDGLVLLLQAVRRALAQLRWAADELEDEIVKAMPHKQVEVAGVGIAELRGGTKRAQWDKDGLVGALIARIADDPTILCDAETGEMLPPARQVERTLARFMEAATPSWKVTGLRAYGIDPDEYCTTSYGRKTIQTPAPEAWPDTMTAEEPSE